MTLLEKLAIKRIRALVAGINVPLTAYALHRGELAFSHEEAIKKDTESSTNFANAERSQREAIEWIGALLEDTSK